MVVAVRRAPTFGLRRRATPSKPHTLFWWSWNQGPRKIEEKHEIEYRSGKEMGFAEKAAKGGDKNDCVWGRGGKCKRECKGGGHFMTFKTCLRAN